MTASKRSKMEGRIVREDNEARRTQAKRDRQKRDQPRNPKIEPRYPTYPWCSLPGWRARPSARLVERRGPTGRRSSKPAECRARGA